MSESKSKISVILGAAAGFVGLSGLAGVLVAAMLAPTIAAAGVAANSSISIFDTLPDYMRIEELAKPSQLFVRQGNKDVLLTSFYDQNREEVKYEELSDTVKNALVAGEDKKFWSHTGVDLAGVIRAAVTGTGGASTITMQYARNNLMQQGELAGDIDLINDALVSEGAEGYKRKIQEIKYAVALEKQYTKEQIIEGYLNIAHFGGITYGIGAAAKRYYGVTHDKLTPAQAASLIAMVQYPNFRSIDVPDREGNGEADGYYGNKVRRDYILQEMYAEGYLTQAEYESEVATPVEPKITPIPNGCQAAKIGGFFCDYVTKILENDKILSSDAKENKNILRRGGLKIYTTLDWDLQMAAEKTTRSWVPPGIGKADMGSALSAIDIKNFHILAMAQNKKYDATDAANKNKKVTSVNYNTSKSYGASTGFQPGSTYKVFTLLAWLQAGGALGEIVDSKHYKDGYPPSDFNNSCGEGSPHVWSPKNDTSGYPTSMTVLKATIQSVNTAFASMAKRVDLCEIANIATRLGLKSGYEVPLTSNQAAILGTNEITPLSMAVAYAGIGNQGKSCDPIAITRIVDAEGKDIKLPNQECRQAVPADVANTAVEALRQAGATYPINTGDGVPVFAKTGTTDAFRHTFLAGGSSRIGIAIWAGNVVGDKEIIDLRRHGVDGRYFRYGMWRDFMKVANKKYKGSSLHKPTGALVGAPKVKIPNVIGMDGKAALDQLEAVGLNPYVRGGASHTYVDGLTPKGTVAKLELPVGKEVTKGTRIRVWYSNGEGIEIPQTAGLSDFNAAVTELQNAGFSSNAANYTIKYELSDSVPAGQVIGTSPAAGRVAGPTKKFTILISEGQGIAAPNLESQTQANALSQLSSLGFTATPTITSQSHPTIPAGSVISYNLTVGTRYLKSVAIKIKISSGP